ncbi:MAG: hypothetical protein HY966_06140 [Ignavibacteriales bacterium]|nr:hypothetical protein [Ignavibacteriales bacterium]
MSTQEPVHDRDGRTNALIPNADNANRPVAASSQQRIANGVSVTESGRLSTENSNEAQRLAGLMKEQMNQAELIQRVLSQGGFLRTPERK